MLTGGCGSDAPACKAGGAAAVGRRGLQGASRDEGEGGRTYRHHVCFGDMSLWAVRAEGSRGRLIASRLHQGTDLKESNSTRDPMVPMQLREEGQSLHVELRALLDGFRPAAAAPMEECSICGGIERNMLFCLLPYQLDLAEVKSCAKERGLHSSDMTGGTFKDVHYEAGFVVGLTPVPDFAMCAWLAQMPGALKGSHLLPISLGACGGRGDGRAAHFELAVVVGSKVHRVKVRVASTHRQVEAWLRANVLDKGTKCLGVDLEWKPQFRRDRPNRVALLQISAGDECLLVPLLHLDSPSMPELLAQVLHDRAIRKVGVGLAQDARLLVRDWRADIISRVDLARAAKEQGLDKLTSLAKCTMHLLGLAMCKSKKIRMGNWEQHPLSLLQSAYAALDAWVAAKGLERLEGHSHVVAPDQSVSRMS
jgi:hypothetical protein